MPKYLKSDRSLKVAPQKQVCDAGIDSRRAWREDCGTEEVPQGAGDAVLVTEVIVSDASSARDRHRSRLLNRADCLCFAVKPTSGSSSNVVHVALDGVDGVKMSDELISG